MASNSAAPSGKSFDLYLDGTDWKLALYASNGTTQIASTTIGGIAVDASSIVDISSGLDLRALGGDAAHEIRVHGAGEIKVITKDVLSKDFPVSALTVSDGEVLGQQVEKIVAIGSGITRVRIAWG